MEIAGPARHDLDVAQRDRQRFEEREGIGLGVEGVERRAAGPVAAVPGPAREAAPHPARA